VAVGEAMVTAAMVGKVVVVGGHQRSSVGSSPVHWLLRIMPLLFRTMRRPMHRHRSMDRGGGVTPRNLITPTHRLAPAGSEPFSRGETETKTRVDTLAAADGSAVGGPPGGLAAGAKGFEPGPPVKGDAVCRAHPDRPPVPSPPRESNDTPARKSDREFESRLLQRRVGRTPIRIKSYSR
jgi:hypothetical protein